MAFLDKEGLIRTIEHIKTHIANEIGKLTKADFGLLTRKLKGGNEVDLASERFL